MRKDDFMNLIDKCFWEREIIMEAKKTSKHDGHPKCKMCGGEGYLFKHPNMIKVNCRCKYDKEYQDYLNKDD